jgi:beta-glucanase (GH16 family)
MTVRTTARRLRVMIPLAAAGVLLAPAIAQAGTPAAHHAAPAAVAPADAPGPGSGWTRVFSDDFGGAAGTAPDGGNWLEDTGTGYPGAAAQWGTGEIESYSTSTQNVYQDGSGNLAIQPIEDGSGNWTSGRIETQSDSFAAPAGGKLQISARIQLPSGGQGIWPAFWALGAPFRPSHTDWPDAGELDVMENIDGQSTVHGTLHCGTDPGGPCNETSGLGGSADLGAPGGSAGFHTYTVTLDQSGTPTLTFSLDGNAYFSVNEDQVGASAWNDATAHGFFVLLNVAVGGGWPGNPDGSTTNGSPMLVDYVTVDTSN